MRWIALALMLLVTNGLLAQNCTTLGQTPATAFPVCGTDTFSQANVPICTTHNLYVPGCDGNNDYQDKNPYWYTFTCYQAGTLGFVITPNNMGDDYDWMLYDITGHNPNDVFTDHSLIVTGNWAGTFGLTGASATGVNYIQCGSQPSQNKPTFSAMPTLKQGHVYLLLVSHFSDSQSGYKLSFGGGTGVITDPKLPKMEKAWAGCGGVTISVKLNKKMKCNSLAFNGSEFAISPAAATVVSATGLGCGNSFDMDTVVLTMSGALPPGNYTLTIKNGGDNNTLLDNCDRNIPPNDNVPFTVFPVQPTPMDSIAPVGCAPNYVDLVFSKPISCNSIAANGSDFVVTGTTPVTVTGAGGVCSRGVSSTIRVQFSAPIQTAGTYQIQLKKGNDGNTIIDECGQETPPSVLTFTTKDTVNADFTYQLFYGCVKDTVQFNHDGRNDVNEWNWRFANDGTSTVQNPRFIFPTFGYKDVVLAVSNGVCKDTAKTTVFLDNAMEAAFFYPEVVCPEDQALFQDSSKGKIISWNWDFGNNITSTSQNPPPQKYPAVIPPAQFKMYTVSLIVENNLHCFDTVTHQVKVVRSCYITVPNAFTPNGDRKNDFLYPLNAYKAVNLEFNIFNRYGQIVFHTTDWTRQWDGTINGLKQQTGVYVWTLSYTDRDTGQKIFRRGTTVLIQ